MCRHNVSLWSVSYKYSLRPWSSSFDKSLFLNQILSPKIKGYVLFSYQNPHLNTYGFILRRKLTRTQSHHWGRMFGNVSLCWGAKSARPSLHSIYRSTSTLLKRALVYPGPHHSTTIVLMEAFQVNMLIKALMCY